MQHGALSLCSLLAANSQISVLIGQKMQLTGCDYGNDMRNAIGVARNVLLEWPYCSFPTLCPNSWLQIWEFRVGLRAIKRYPSLASLNMAASTLLGSFSFPFVLLLLPILLSLVSYILSYLLVFTV